MDVSPTYAEVLAVSRNSDLLGKTCYLLSSMKIGRERLSGWPLPNPRQKICRESWNRSTNAKTFFAFNDSSLNENKVLAGCDWQIKSTFCCNLQSCRYSNKVFSIDHRSTKFWRNTSWRNFMTHRCFMPAFCGFRATKKSSLKRTQNWWKKFVQKLKNFRTISTLIVKKSTNYCSKPATKSSKSFSVITFKK